MSETTPRDLLSLVEATFTRALESEGGTLTQDGLSRALKTLSHEPAFGGTAPSDTFVFPHPITMLTDPFEVLLARRFMHLMATPGGRTLNEGALSLRVLPGFFQVVRMMIGADKYKHYHTECNDLAKRLKTEGPVVSAPEFAKVLSAHPEAKHISLAVYARMGLWFSQYKKRKDWFISIINTNLGAVPAGLKDPGEKRWQFTSGHFTELFTVLFLEDVIITVLDENARKGLEDEFGKEAIAQLNEMLGSLGTDMDQYFCGKDD